MKDKKKTLSIIMIYGIVLATITLIYFLVPIQRTASSWIAYIFADLSLVGGLLITYLAFRNAKMLKSKFYGVPVFRLGIFYTCVQLIVSVIFVVVEIWVSIPFWITLTVSLILTSLICIGTIVSDNMRDVVEAIEERHLDSLSSMTDISNEFASVVDIAKDETIKSKLQEISEKLRYSDPVSAEATKSAEEEIKITIRTLKSSVIENDIEKASTIVENLMLLIDKRNRLCKSNK